MKTLLFGGSVNIDVINVWCDYLNNGNRLRDRRSISRLFLTETTDIASLDINYRDVKLVLFPVVAPSPLLHCFDIDHNLYEVIHPCDPGCVDFHASVQYVKKQLSAKLSSMIPKLHATYFVVAKEYVPNKSFSVARDTGIYMMRHMETYNGNKCRYTLKLLKDRTDVKRYIVRVCNEILTWQDNIVKDQVTSKAKAYKNGCVIRNEVPRDLPYTDEHLMNFIRTNVANTDDIVVDTPWLQVTQEGMSTLFGGKWIMDMVIDLVGLRLTLERPSLVYFPTIIKVFIFILSNR
ncbi:uncharacterized protein LOC141601183 [Silene latifolia]|uniref:uncharacterized protein LOC141601183 n=1 Tax=Silene latifolia TaxID=37657 RepID=UPI003D77011C